MSPITRSDWNWFTWCIRVIFVGLDWQIGNTHLVENDAKGPHVNLRTDQGVRLFEFWSHILFGSTEFNHSGFPELTFLVNRHNLWHSKICNFKDLEWFWLVLLEEQIGRLQISVDYTFTVDDLKSLEDLRSIVPEQGFVLDLFFLLGQTVFKLLCLVAILHKHHNLLFVLSVGVEVHNVWLVLEELVDDAFFSGLW